MMPLTALDHYTIRTSDLDRAVRFYAEILGLESGARPPFRFPGAWLYCDGRPVVHLAVRGQKAGGEAGGETGALDHLAFRADDRAEFTRHLAERGVAFEQSEVPGLGLHQVFLRDPDGVRIEVNFPGEAPA